MRLRKYSIRLGPRRFFSGYSAIIVHGTRVLDSHRFFFWMQYNYCAYDLEKIQLALNPPRKKYISISIYSTSMVYMELRKNLIKLDPHRKKYCFWLHYYYAMTLRISLDNRPPANSVKFLFLATAQWE